MVKEMAPLARRRNTYIVKDFKKRDMVENAWLGEFWRKLLLEGVKKYFN